MLCGGYKAVRFSWQANYLNAISTARCGEAAEECKEKARTYEACPDVLAFEYGLG